MSNNKDKKTDIKNSKDKNQAEVNYINSKDEMVKEEKHLNENNHG